MRVLVTGGCGYVGCHAVDKLLAAGHDVVVADKCLFPSGVKYVQSLGVEIVEVDIRDILLFGLGQSDAIIHLAGLSNDPSSAYSPQGNHEMNVVATKRMCEQATKIDCKRFIFASSASVYGFNNEPKLDENAPLNPCSYYAESKIRGEEFVRQIGGTILRQATIMGWSPRHRNDLVVNTMLLSALQAGRIMVNAGGEAFRPLVDVQDVSEAYCRLLSAPLEMVVGQTLNLNHRRAIDGPLEGYTIACLALWIKHLLEKNYHINVDAVGNWETQEGRSYDITSRKLRTLLDWEPQRGVHATIESLMEHRNELVSHEALNIDWMKALEHGQRVTQRTGRVFV